MPALSHGWSKTKLCERWAGMRARCYNPNHKAFDYYGGRGIIVCEEWSDFSNFKEWVLENGFSPELELDRIDNNGNYCPENCRFVTRTMNLNNTSKNVFITAFGETKTYSEWSRDSRCKTSVRNLQKRIQYRDWPPEKAITTPDAIQNKTGLYRKSGEPNPIILCACGCETEILKYAKGGAPRKFVSGHNLHPVKPKINNEIQTVAT